VATLALLIAIAVVVAASDPLHRAITGMIEIAQPVLREHALTGAAFFVVLAALSAMAVFFSTAVIVPLAVDAFGPLTTLILLWTGWIIGALTAYAIARTFGRRFVSVFIEPWRLAEYERRARGFVRFRHVLLFQLAVPSEIPSYVLGLAHCPFRIYFAAMALGELPFAIGAVYLGQSFLQRNYLLLAGLGLAGLLFSVLVFRIGSRTWQGEMPLDDPRARPRAVA
jgi:uncharacterized membrane protein YdjX (TVP38/TMEM64 family)